MDLSIILKRIKKSLGVIKDNPENIVPDFIEKYPEVDLSAIYVELLTVFPLVRLLFDENSKFIDHTKYKIGYHKVEIDTKGGLASMAKIDEHDFDGDIHLKDILSMSLHHTHMSLRYEPLLGNKEIITLSSEKTFSAKQVCES